MVLLDTLYLHRQPWLDPSQYSSLPAVVQRNPSPCLTYFHNDLRTLERFIVTDIMSNDMPFELSVSGHAMIAHPAERAVINVTVSSTGTNKASVVDEVVTTAKHVEEMLRVLSPQDDTAEAKAASPLAHWNKTSLSSRCWMPRDDKNNEMPPMKYSSNVRFDIRFKEFKALGSFGTRISSIPHVSVNEIDWILTTDSENSYLPRLRRDCAHDALQKARDYCEILRCTNLRPVSLTVSYPSRTGREPPSDVHRRKTTITRMVVARSGSSIWSCSRRAAFQTTQAVMRGPTS